MEAISPAPDGTRLRIHLQPGAKRSAVQGRYGDALKIAISAPPVDGKANLELCRFLAKACQVPLADVELCSGLTSRDKQLLIRGRSPEEIRDLLEK